MINPKYDVSHIKKELLRFLEYTCSGHRSDDPILLELIQAFRDVIFYEIVMSQQEVHHIFEQYEACDGIIVPITRGQCQCFAYAVLYAQYRYSQVKTDRDTHNPSRWTKKQYKNWMQQVQTKQGPVATIIANLIKIGLTELQTSQFVTRMNFLVKFLSKIHRHNQFNNKKISPAICVTHLMWQHLTMKF